MPAGSAWETLHSMREVAIGTQVVASLIKQIEGPRTGIAEVTIIAISACGGTPLTNISAIIFVVEIAA